MLNKIIYMQIINAFKLAGEDKELIEMLDGLVDEYCSDPKFIKDIKEMFEGFQLITLNKYKVK